MRVDFKVKVFDYYVKCDLCLTCGPRGETEDEAVKQWNTRKGEKGE